jgi:hypothetical protein
MFRASSDRRVARKAPSISQTKIGVLYFLFSVVCSHSLLDMENLFGSN